MRQLRIRKRTDARENSAATWEATVKTADEPGARKNRGCKWKAAGEPADPPVEQLKRSASRQKQKKHMINLVAKDLLGPPLARPSDSL